MKARHKGSEVKPGIVAHLEADHGAIVKHRKRGGRVGEDKAHERAGEKKMEAGRKRESEGEKKHLEKMHGEKAPLRLDRPGRKRGGRVGADSSPLSSAGKGDHPHSADDEMGGPRAGCEPGYSHGGGVKKKR